MPAEYHRDWYLRNKDRIRERKRRLERERRKSLVHQVVEYLSEHPCVDCGEGDPVVLHFDHRDAAEKVVNVADALSRGWSWLRMQTEIEKCDVRCANCHQRRTAKQFGWHKLVA